MATWRVLVLTGSEDAVRAFALGFAAGRGEPGDAVLGGDVGVEPASFGERLKELFGAGGHHVVFAPEPLASALALAVQQFGGAVGLGLERSRSVAETSFGVRIETFSRALADEVRAILRTSLPDGVLLDGLTEQEEEHPEAHGAELYAPLHAYAYRATGRITGVLPGVLDVRRRLAEFEFVQLEPLDVRGIAEPG
jgi:hypothetical protein